MYDTYYIYTCTKFKSAVCSYFEISPLIGYLMSSYCPFAQLCVRLAFILFLQNLHRFVIKLLISIRKSLRNPPLQRVCWVFHVFRCKSTTGKTGINWPSLENYKRQTTNNITIYSVYGTGFSGTLTSLRMLYAIVPGCRKLK